MPYVKVTQVRELELDIWSRRVVGWAIGEAMTENLVFNALNIALQQRKPGNVIYHRDQGGQCAAGATPPADNPAFICLTNDLGTQVRFRLWE